MIRDEVTALWRSYLLRKAVRSDLMEIVGKPDERLAGIFEANNEYLIEIYGIKLFEGMI